jgi:DNA-binding CsgD family transcriptional regulator
MDLSELSELQGTLDTALVGFIATTRNCLDTRYAEAQLVGDDVITKKSRIVFEGRSTKEIWDPDIAPDELNRFSLPVQRARRRGLVKVQEAHRQVYEPLGLSDTIRMLVFDGALCVGWFGAVRWAVAPTFKPHELRLARTYLEGAAAHSVCDLSGAVVAHSYQVGHWLTRDRRRRVRESVRFAAVKGHARAVIGNYAWRVARLEGSSGDLVYLNAPLGSFGAVNLSVLSTRQRQVAQLIALGLTTKEVAEELGLSPHTVKQHLSRAYRLLGVRRREQLIERLCR